MTAPKLVTQRNKYRRFDKKVTVPIHVEEKIKTILKNGSFTSLQDICNDFKEYNITRGYIMKLSRHL